LLPILHSELSENIRAQSLRNLLDARENQYKAAPAIVNAANRAAIVWDG
jgi:hypothetical protein